jgi:hypothetical protein
MGSASPLPPPQEGQLPKVLDLSATEIVVGVGAAIALVAYVVLIVVPAWTSYGRWWERIAASFMTIFILATLVGVGAGIGAAIVWSWDRWA